LEQLVVSLSNPPTHGGGPPLAALANFGVVEQRSCEVWNRRSRIAQIRFQLDSSEAHRQALSAVLALLQEYQDTL
jgi:hypothetical protein